MSLVDPARSRLLVAVRGHLALLGLLAGCTVVNGYDDPALVGDWESPEPIANGEHNRLEVDLDGEGKATILYSPDGVYLHEDRFEHEWQQTDEEEFEVELTCRFSSLLDRACGAHDFAMTCDAKSGGDELRCESKHPYAAPTLRWDRQ